MTYEEISNQYGIPLTTIYSRIHTLKIRGRYVGQKKILNKLQVQTLLEYNPNTSTERAKKNNHRRKLAIIEFYQKLGSGNKVATLLNIDRTFVQAAIREFNETGYVIVASKMNNER